MVSSDHPVPALIVHKLRCPPIRSCYNVQSHQTMCCAIKPLPQSFIIIKEYLYELCCTKNKTEVIECLSLSYILTKRRQPCLGGQLPQSSFSMTLTIELYSNSYFWSNNVFFNRCHTKSSQLQLQALSSFGNLLNGPSYQNLIACYAFEILRPVLA